MRLVEYWEPSARDRKKMAQGNKDVIQLMTKAFRRNPEARRVALEDFGKFIRKARNDDVYQKLMHERNRYRQAVDDEDWRQAAIISFDAFQEHTNLAGHRSYMFAGKGMNG